MVSLRILRWPDDREPLRALDTSFTTDRIYQVVATDLSFVLRETPIAPALHKDYHFVEHLESLPSFDYVVVAEVDGALAGMAALKVEAWNRRAVLWHIYIGQAYRREGIGRALVDDVMRAARERQARCLWLETQNVNYDAIQFYRRVGFRCCGLDMTLYDSDGPDAAETALFFVHPLV